METSLRSHTASGDESWYQLAIDEKNAHMYEADYWNPVMHNPDSFGFAQQPRSLIAEYQPHITKATEYSREHQDYADVNFGVPDRQYTKGKASWRQNDGQDDDGQGSERPRHPGKPNYKSSSARKRRLPCPYGIADPLTFSECAERGYRFLGVTRVKEHILRKHSIRIPRECHTWEQVFFHCLPGWSGTPPPLATVYDDESIEAINPTLHSDIQQSDLGNNYSAEADAPTDYESYWQSNSGHVTSRSARQSRRGHSRGYSSTDAGYLDEGGYDEDDMTGYTQYQR